MTSAIDTLRTSIARVRYLGGLYDAILSLTTPAIDASDLLRAQIVLAVSALDYYVHEITAIGMTEVLSGKRPSTPAFLKYRVSMDAVFGSSAVSGNSWFESDIRERHSYLSFQRPEKIAEAVRLFSDVKLWRDVSTTMAMPEDELKARLKLIVDRRNKIAHEADIDPSYPGMRWPITKQDVDQTIEFVLRTCESIHSVVT